MTENRASNRPLFIVLAATLTATGLGIGYYLYQQPTPEPETTPTLAKAETPVSSPAANTLPTPPISAVLSELFGVKTSTDKLANTPEQLSSLWFAQPFTQGQDNFYVFFIKTQAIDPETKTIVDSHADAPNISIAVYKQVEQQWQLEAKQINVGSLGSWGDVPEIKSAATLQLSADNLAFLIDSGFSGQGYTEEGKGLFNYNSKTKTWQDLGFIATGGDNAGACDDRPQPADSLLSACWKFSGEITLSKESKNPDFPDLLVIKKGTTSDDNNKIIPATNSIYTFNGEQYVEAGVEAF